MARVGVSAVASIVDIFTDLYITCIFSQDVKTYGLFYASLTSLLLSAFLQIFTVWFIYRPLGKMRAVRECSWILIGLKPAVDAYRVASGKKQEAKTLMPPLNEMAGMKVIEMFAEAIPGVIIQLMAIATAKGGSVGSIVWLSVAVSAFTIGFGSATISYDWDTDPKCRQGRSNFYGFVPASVNKRLRVFCSMVMITSSNLMIRSMTIVILGLVGRTWVFAYIGADLGLYLIVKLLRDDFWYHLQMGGNIEIVSSILFRVVGKIVVDFTSIVQLRHSQELGGVQWICSFVVSMVSLPIATKIYEVKGGDTKNVQLAWKTAWTFIPIVSISFGVLFYNMDHKYIGTFFSTQTGKGMNHERFKNGANDQIKLQIFYHSRHFWVGIEDEMKQFIAENWEKWEINDIYWFDDVLKATVPIEWIPTSNSRNRESLRRGSVRRRSLLDSIPGNLHRVAPPLLENQITPILQ
mmetsp:Transcript_8732/g.17684  ORF Transcript_8732/g.17684 Transcript_8732/m.17684 type:complete len:464 (-) Transcript_8732:1299-2690(-)